MTCYWNILFIRKTLIVSHSFSDQLLHNQLSFMSRYGVFADVVHRLKQNRVLRVFFVLVVSLQIILCWHSPSSWYTRWVWVNTLQGTDSPMVFQVSEWTHYRVLTAHQCTRWVWVNRLQGTDSPPVYQMILSEHTTGSSSSSSIP